LRHVFTIARESIAVQRTLIVELEEEGLSGYGEATTNAYYGATIETMTGALLAVRKRTRAASIGDPAQLWDALYPALKEHPFAQCALDQAAHDLWGKRLGQPVYELWGLSLQQLPPSNYTIGIDTIETMVRKMQEFPDWPVYKIKLGTRTIWRSSASCAAHRRGFPSRCELRLDSGTDVAERPR
jgi:L-Ala-D/L-Glu epimerase